MSIQTHKPLWAASGGIFEYSSPAIANGVLYVTSDTLYAFNARTGKKLWENKDITPSSAPSVANGVVYAGDYGVDIYAINAATGKTLKIVKSLGEIFSSPAICNGRIWTGSTDFHIHAIGLK